MFSLCPLPLVLSLGTTEKILGPSSWYPPFRYLCTLMRSLLSLLFSRLNSPSSLSPSLDVRCSRPLVILVAFHWTLSIMSMSLVYSRALNWTTLLQVWPHLCRVGGKEHLLQPSGSNPPNAAQDATCVLCHQGALLAYVQLGLHQDPHPFLQSCFSARWPPACTGEWVFCLPGAGLCASPCCTSWGSSQSISPACWGPSGWQHGHPSFVTCKPAEGTLCPVIT